MVGLAERADGSSVRDGASSMLLALFEEAQMFVRVARFAWVVLCLGWSSAGCASLTELARQESCSRDAAYAAGVAAGKAGSAMASNFAWGCPMPDGLNESYQSGYKAGSARARD